MNSWQCCETKTNIKLRPLTSFVWHFHLKWKTDTANWKLPYSALSVLDNFVSAGSHYAGNVSFFSPGCLISVLFQFILPLMGLCWLWCAVSQFSCQAANAPSTPLVGAQGHPGCPATFPHLERELADGESIFEMHLDLRMSYFEAGSWRLSESCRVYGRAAGQ